MVGWWGAAPVWAVGALALVGLAAPFVRLRHAAWLMLAAALALGLARGAHHVASQPPPLRAEAGSTIQIEGQVAETSRGPRRIIEVRTARVPARAAARPAAGLIETFVHEAVLPAGAVVTVSGAFEPFGGAARNPLDGYHDAYVGRIELETSRVVEAPVDRDPPLLTRLRTHIDASLRSALPEPHASLLSAMLVGIRTRLPPAVRDDFLTSGLIHVVAISGFNVTLMALAIRRLAGWAIGRYGVALAAVALPLYAVLAGGDPSVVRAAIMGDLLLIAWIVGRDTDALTALSLAAGGMVLIQPQALADVGFQLSFAGTVGLIVLTPPLARMLHQRVRVPRLGAEFLGGTVAASVMVTPIIAHTFDRFQLMAVPANLLALAAPPWIMATGVPVAVWSSSGWPGAEVVAWVAWLPLEYLLQTARLVATLPGAAMPVSDFTLAHAAAVYVCLGLAALLIGRPRQLERAATTRGPLIPPRVGYGLAALALALPPVLAATGAPRLLDDAGTYITVDFGGRAPTAYVRRGEDTVVVAGDRVSRLILDRALPRWDLVLDGVVAPGSGGAVSHAALALLDERPIAAVLAPAPHGLGEALETPDRSRRAPVVGKSTEQFGDIAVSFWGAEGGRWTLVTTPELTAAIAPAEVEAGPIVVERPVDVLILGRRNSAAATAARNLAAAGVQVIVAPHARLQTAVARAVTADGSIVLPAGTAGAGNAVFTGTLTVWSDGESIEVRRPRG